MMNKLCVKHGNLDCAECRNETEVAEHITDGSPCWCNPERISYRGDVSDGYHTFDELYEHRTILFIQLCRFYVKFWSDGDGGSNVVWRSLLHDDGSNFDGWFIMGIHKEPGRQISYHLPLSQWDNTEFVDETLERSPKWDGHTSADVVERLKKVMR